MFSRCVVSDKQLIALARNRLPDTLKTLRLAHSTLTDESFVVLAETCVQLETVDISGCHFVGELGFAALAQLPYLANLTARVRTCGLCYFVENRYSYT